MRIFQFLETLKFDYCDFCIDEVDEELVLLTNSVYRQLFKMVHAEHGKALENNKDFLIMLGENHFSFMSFLIKQILIDISTKFYSINSFLMEADDRMSKSLQSNNCPNLYWQTTYNVATIKGMKVMPIDLPIVQDMLDHGVSLADLKGVRDGSMITHLNNFKGGALMNIGYAHMDSILTGARSYAYHILKDNRWIGFDDGTYKPEYLNRYHVWPLFWEDRDCNQIEYEEYCKAIPVDENAVWLKLNVSESKYLSMYSNIFVYIKPTAVIYVNNARLNLIDICNGDFSLHNMTVTECENVNNFTENYSVITAMLEEYELCLKQFTISFAGSFIGAFCIQSIRLLMTNYLHSNKYSKLQILIANQLLTLALISQLSTGLIALKSSILVLRPILQYIGLSKNHCDTLEMMLCYTTDTYRWISNTQNSIAHLISSGSGWFCGTRAAQWSVTRHSSKQGPSQGMKLA